MTPTEAEDLATLCKQTWPRGPETAQWEAMLTPLDHGKAGTAYARLKASARTAPVTIDAFLATYGPITRPHRTAPDCPECENTGWAVVVQLVDDRRTEAVEPCRCDWGDDRRHVHGTVLEHNRNTLDGLFPHRTDPRYTRSTR